MVELGYSLTGVDNDSFFIDDEANPITSTCSRCGYMLDFINYFNPYFRLKRKTYDLSSTYDLRYIVSLRFKEFCLREGYENLVFKEFEKEFGFFQFLPKNILAFDEEIRRTEFINFCEVCKNYREVVGATPAYLKDKIKKIEEGFYRTDLLFGSGNRKQPLIIVAPETFKKLKREKFKGLIFDSVLT